MRTVFVLFDSLNRRALECYGATHTPTSPDLLKKVSLLTPTMLVALCLHVAKCRQADTFLHRSWGPLEPFDVSLPEVLREGGT